MKESAFSYFLLMFLVKMLEIYLWEIKRLLQLLTHSKKIRCSQSQTNQIMGWQRQRVDWWLMKIWLECSNIKISLTHTEGESVVAEKIYQSLKEQNLQKLDRSIENVVLVS